MKEVLLSLCKVACVTALKGQDAGVVSLSLETISHFGRFLESKEKNEYRVFVDQLYAQLEALCVSENIPDNERRVAIQTTEDLFLRHGLSSEELASFNLDPSLASRELKKRGRKVLKEQISESEEALAGRLIDKIYEFLLASSDKDKDLGIHALRESLQRLEELLTILERLENQQKNAKAPTPEMATKQYLVEALKLSEARCLASWQALGLSLKEASDLFEDSQVGMPSEELTAKLEANNVVILAGELGTGKSLMVERLLQNQTRETLRNKGHLVPALISSVEIPIKQTGVELLGVVKRRLPSLQLEDQGTLLIVEISESENSRIHEIEHQANVLVNRYSKSKVVLTVRPFNQNGRKETVSPAPLSPNEYLALIKRVVGRTGDTENLSVFLATLSSSIKEAITRPLFAIMLGVYFRERGSNLLTSNVELVRFMVDKALAQSNSAQAALEQLAFMSVDRKGASVPRGDIGPPEQVKLAEQSGLTIEEGGRVRFVLPLLCNWFASQSLASGAVGTRALVEDRQRLEAWRESLILAVGLFGAKEVENILHPIAEKYPGFAASIISNALSYGVSFHESRSPPPASECGERIVASYRGWLTGLEEIKDEIAPLDLEGELRAPYVSVAKKDVCILFCSEPAPNDGRGFMIIQPKRFAELHESLGTECLTTRVGEQAGWWWRTSLDQVARALSKKLKARDFTSDITDAKLEQAWCLSKRMLRGTAGPIPLDELEHYLNSLKEDKWYDLRRGVEHELTPLKEVIEVLRGRGCEYLASPCPGPDLPKHQYSDQRLLERIRWIYSTALELYKSFVDRWLPRVRPDLRKYQMLPLTQRVFLEREEGGDSLWDYDIPLPIGKETCVEVELFTQKSNNLRLAHGEARQAIIDHRSHAPWLHTRIGKHHLGVWSARRPAIELAHRWLFSDLEAIGLATGHFSFDL